MAASEGRGLEIAPIEVEEQEIEGGESYQYFIGIDFVMEGRIGGVSYELTEKEYHRIKVMIGQGKKEFTYRQITDSGKESDPVLLVLPPFTIGLTTFRKRKPKNIILPTGPQKLVLQ